MRARGISSVLLLLALAGGACRTGVPVLDTSAPPPSTDGTIAGTVRGPGNTAPVAGRTVTATSTRSALTFEALTNAEGSYSMKVPPGRYRLRIALREGEQLYDEPGEVTVDPSDIEAGQDFIVLGPRSPSR